MAAGGHHHALYLACREQQNRKASPTVAIVDSQRVNRKRVAWIDPPGYDAGKTIKGRKRYMLRRRLLLHAIMPPADIPSSPMAAFCCWAPVRQILLLQDTVRRCCRKGGQFKRTLSSGSRICSPAKRSIIEPTRCRRLGSDRTTATVSHSCVSPQFASCCASCNPT
jgi:hypothetical protein